MEIIGVMASKVAMPVRVNSISSLRSNRDERRPPNPSPFVLFSGVSMERSFRLPSSLAPSLFQPLRYSRRLRPSCFSDSQQSSQTISIEDLRRQLEALHLEAQQARGRANAARARFMRLTETVENLRMRAITDLKSGKEESARQSIAEKQKVMQALEKSKQRAELLEELCNKLSEAISSKELQVMASLTSATVGVNQSNAATDNVRIVSPKADDLASDGVVNSEEIWDSVGEEGTGRMDLANNQNAEASRPDIGANDDTLEIDDQITNAINAMLPTNAETYPDFLSRIDYYLHEAEVQLRGFLNIAAMVVPEDVEKNTKERVSVVRQIWQDVLVARARIRKAVPQQDFG